MSRDLFETDSPDYSADRLLDYADAIKEQNREALLSHDRVGEQGPEESETNFIIEHEGEAA